MKLFIMRRDQFEKVAEILGFDFVNSRIQEFGYSQELGGHYATIFLNDKHNAALLLAGILLRRV